MDKSNLYKGCLEAIILQLLKSESKMYGYQITQRVKELTNNELTITEGALYPLLHKLEEDGILEAEVAHVGNRMRKYYALTKKGKKQTTLALQELKSFMQHLNTLFDNTLDPA